MASSTDVMKNVSTQYPGYSDLTPGRVISRAQLLQFLSCYHTGEQETGLTAETICIFPCSGEDSDETAGMDLTFSHSSYYLCKA